VLGLALELKYGAHLCVGPAIEVRHPIAQQKNRIPGEAGRGETVAYVACYFRPA
jgi:hypothetical protein